jgi:hypothetical protein
VSAQLNPSRAPPWLGACFALWAQLATGPTWSQPSAADREHQVKAVFLFNFTRFVEWPQNAFPDAQAPLSICVLGADPFGSYLDDVVRGETVQGRPLVVSRLRAAEEGASCHILFVSNSESARLAEVQAALQGKPVLSVSDLPGFIADGGIVRFETVSGKIRLSINPGAAKRAGLTVSSKLLRSADIVASD